MHVLWVLGPGCCLLPSGGALALRSSDSTCRLRGRCMELNDVHTLQDTLYVQCRERSDSACLCISCSRMFPSLLLRDCWLRGEVSLHAVCSLCTAFYCLPSSLLIAALLQDAGETSLLNPPVLILFRENKLLPTLQAASAL